MRYWKFGQVDSWLFKDQKRYRDFDTAFRKTPAGSNHVFLYEGSKLVVSADLTKFFRGFAKRHEPNYVTNDVDADLAVHRLMVSSQIAPTADERYAILEREVTSLLEEKQREQSNGNRPKRRRRRH